MENIKSFDVIIIGGSYSGLSAAMALGRSLRSVLIIDSGLPCNRQTPHSHNFLTQDGQTPAAIASLARRQVEAYESVTFYTGLAIKGNISNGGFEIEVQTEGIFRAKKLLFATGIKDQLPEIKGFSDCWGISVIHCPYCHGYEVRDKRTGVLATGDIAMHYAGLVNNLTRKLSIFSNGKSNLTSDQLLKLQEHNIGLIDTEIAVLEHSNGQIENVVFKDGARVAVDALYAGVRFEQHCSIPVSLGCELTEQGYIKVDNLQRTTVPGIYACGDNSSMMRSVATAVATGQLAGAAINKQLIDEAF